MQKQASNLREGDTIDLEGDPYADPDGEWTLFKYELTTVTGTERETPGCVRIDTDMGSYGFPPSHEIAVHKSVCS